jgi:hypothetical protein
MRYAKQKSTGKILESQGGGNPDNPLHLSTMMQNAVNGGFDEADIEVGYADDDVVEGWIKEQDESAMGYSEKRLRSYPPIGDQLDALWKGGDDAEAMKAIVNKVKSDNPK